MGMTCENATVVRNFLSALGNHISNSEVIPMIAHILLQTLMHNTNRVGQRFKNIGRIIVIGDISRSIIKERRSVV